MSFLCFHSSRQPFMGDKAGFLDVAESFLHEELGRQGVAVSVAAVLPRRSFVIFSVEALDRLNIFL